MTGRAFIGLDIGSSTTKAVVIDREKLVRGHAVVFSRADFVQAAEEALREARRKAGLGGEEPGALTATGYGRRSLPFAAPTLTEISCHARGSFHFFPRAHTLIDIGGQDSKIIKVDARGRRTGFKMNRKCAAGTGAFLEEVANRLKVGTEALNALAEGASRDIPIGSYCTVFTATEILALIRQNVDVRDIVRGVFRSVIKRAKEMAPLEGDIVMSGGVVAYNPFLVRMFEEDIGRKIAVPSLPQLTGAFGAALYALEREGG